MTTFQFAVAMAAVTEARFARGQEHHAAALKEGARAIEEEKRLADQHKAEWRKVQDARARGERSDAPQRHHVFGESQYKPATPRILINDWADGRGFDYEIETRRESFKNAGHLGYEGAKRALRNQPLSEPITVELSRHALLRLAGLSLNGINQHRIISALCRLERPIVIAGGYCPPVLARWQELPSGRLLLHVNPEWLPPKKFGQVPFPLPTRSPTAMALYLLLHYFAAKPINRSGIRLENLYGRLGIPMRFSSAACARALQRALDLVNAHLRKFDTEALRKQGVEVQRGFRITPVNDGRNVLFEAVRNPGRYADWEPGDRKPVDAMDEEVQNKGRRETRTQPDEFDSLSQEWEAKQRAEERGE